MNLAVNGEVQDPASGLGEHVNDCWPELVGPADRSLVHWLRRLVFRSAWLDQRVKEGELDVAFDADTHTFAYVQPDRDDEPIELAPEPSWGRVASRPDCAAGAGAAGPIRAASARALAIASAPASPTSSSGAQRAAAGQVERREAAAAR